MRDSLKVCLKVSVVCSVVFAIGSLTLAQASTKVYQLKGRCGGLPRVDLKTPPGFCVGMVDQGEELIMPRGIVSLDSNTLLLVDMGGWTQDNGRIYLFRRDSANFKRELILDKNKLTSQDAKILDRPHGAAIGLDGKVYIASAGTIFRFKPLDSSPEKTIEVIVKDLPDDGRHPLKSIVFDSAGYLYLNIGSLSDHCETQEGFPPDPKRQCMESDGQRSEKRRGVIRRYSIDPQGNIDPHFTVFAEGLRNSMALALHPKSHILFQGENGSDGDAQIVPEELNLIEEGKHYGWPYCSGDAPSAEYPNSQCSKYQSPSLLWPAHAAPLGMYFYQGKMFPADYFEKLIVAFHGYRDSGHRIVVFDSDRHGHPIGKPFNLVYGWDESKSHPKGSPVAMTVAEDGSLFVTEDRNHTILRIYFDPAEVR